MNRTIPTAHWRLASGFAIAHVVLMLAGLMLQGTPALREGREGIQRSYVEGELARIMAGGYLEVIGFLCLIPVVVFLGYAVGRRSDAAGWAAMSAAALGIGYVAVTVSSGFPPGAAALWGAQHGLDIDTALALNNVRNFAYFLSLALLGGHAIGLGVASIWDGFSTRWVGWGGVLTGTVLLAAVPAAGLGLQDYATLVWLVWWIGLAVMMLRRPANEPNRIPEMPTVRQA
jgi:hypothetical protein